MNKNLCLMLACLSIVGLSQAQNKAVEFDRFTLDNGLKVILHEDHSTPIVAVSVMYHVGSKNENPERTGFAHFFEHLLFEGSENIGRGEYDNYVEGAGGVLNANTTQDRTFYYELLPSNQLELALWLESERMLHAKVEKVGIETQREVVKEERRQRIDNRPYGSILEEVVNRAYTEHPYRWSVIGSMEHLNAAKDEEFKEFYKTYYVPNNAILSIAGDIEKDQAKEWINKYFATIPKGQPVPRPSIKEPRQTEERRDVIYDNVQLPAVVHAYHIPQQGTPDYYAVRMLSTLLSQGESSRYNQKLVNEQQLALFIGSFPLPMEDPGLNLSFAIASLGIEPSQLEEEMDKELADLRDQLISEQEYQKVLNQIENSFISRRANMAGIAEQLANYEMYFGDANLINTELERYKAVSREDIRNAARKYMVAQNRVALYYLPKSQEQNP